LSLRSKTTLIVAVTLGALLVVMYASSRYFLLDNFLSLEKYEGIGQVERATNALTEQLSNLDSVTEDWSCWDDAYAYVVNPVTDFAANLNDATFENVDVDVVLCYNNSRQLVYQKTVGIKYENKGSLASILDSALRKHDGLIIHQPAPGAHQGLIYLSGNALLISSHPILNNLGQGPVHGTLVMGRLIDPRLIKQIEATTRLKLNINSYAAWYSALTSHEKAAFSKPTPGKAQIRVLNSNRLQGYEVLNDIDSNPALVLAVDLPRSIYQQGRTSMNYYLISLLFIGLVFGATAIFWLESAILKPLYKLKNTLQQIKDLHDINIRMEVASSDEIGAVGVSINNMLAALDDAHTKLIENDIHLHRITDNMLDILTLVDLDSNIHYCSPSFLTILGYQPEKLVGHSVYELICPDEQEAITDTMLNMIRFGSTSTAVCRILHAQGYYIWMESTSSLLRDTDTNEITGIALVSRDITQRKAAEDSLIYLSEHDPMTNLYNRMFFRQQVTSLDRAATPNFGAICCDLNGLRLINDTMGYQVGDSLIVASAELLTICTPTGALLARTGGDEFTMFIPDADSSLLDATCRHIATTIQSFNEDHPDVPLSLSVGSAAGTGKDSIQDKLIEAAGNMYRDKLHQHTSGRSAVVATLMQALQERDFITSGHADRMEKLVARMAEVCQLSTSQINDLRLLARFHDIGKVGVKDNLLFKPSKLTAEEHKEMQRHCEIGYRIAQSAPHLRHISEWILKHHEWWNGDGYPLGLKGEDIPKECRILAIADAYDAMTSERPYRKPVSHEEALEELRRCAGTQFDPWLTVDFICMWPAYNENDIA